MIIFYICYGQSRKSGIVHNDRALCTMPDFQGQSWNKLMLPGHCVQCPIRFGHCKLNIEYIKKLIKYLTENIINSLSFVNFIT